MIRTSWKLNWLFRLLRQSDESGLVFFVFSTNIHSKFILFCISLPHRHSRPPPLPRLQSRSFILHCLSSITDGQAELTEHPKKVKLERLRQASVPQCYLPAVDSEQLFRDLLVDGWNRAESSIRKQRTDNKRNNGTNSKLIEPDEPSLSSDGIEAVESNRGSTISTGPDTSSRVDRFRLRFNQIKVIGIEESVLFFYRISCLLGLQKADILICSNDYFNQW